MKIRQGQPDINEGTARESIATAAAFFAQQHQPEREQANKTASYMY